MRKVLLCLILLLFAVSNSAIAASITRDWQETLQTSGTVVIDRIQVYLAEAYDSAGNPTIRQFDLSPYAIRLANNTRVWVPGTTTQTEWYDAGSGYNPVATYWGVPNSSGLTQTTISVHPVTGQYVTYVEPMQNWVNAAKDIAVIEAPSYIKGSFLGIREYWATAVPAAGKVYYQFYKDGVLVDSCEYYKAVGAGSWTMTDTNTSSNWNQGFIDIGATTYTITASAGTGGTISPSGSVTVNSGANQTFTVTPNTGYSISQVTVDGVNQGAITSYSFTNVTANHTISATFSADPTTYTITATAGTGGTISPSGAVVVNSGADQTFTITPNAGYYIVDVTLDGVSQGALDSLTLVNVAANHTVNATFANDLVAYYRFDETTGTSAYDSSGNNRTATLNGSCTWVAGKYANAVNIPGGTSSVSLPSGVVSGLTNFSVATWVKLTSLSAYMRIFDFGTSTSNYMMLTPQHATSKGKVQFSISSGGTTQSLTGRSALSTGSWQHVVVTRSGNTGTLYVNGSQVAQTTTMTLSPSSLGTTTNNWIGDSQTSSHPHLNGLVDGFRIYNRALTAAEVTSLYNDTPTTYTITASAGSNGTISPSGNVTVSAGASQTFTITPNAGYAVSQVTVDGVNQGAITSYTFSSVSANHSISATFSAVTYTITASAGTGGTISPSGAVVVNSGADQTFTITPNAGYQISQVTVDGANQGAISSYTFTNVTANHTISATFSANTTTYTITASAANHGSISPSGSVVVNSGASQTFNITADSGYYISDVVVDGSSVGAVSSYTFSNVTANHTISASFAASSTSTLIDINVSSIAGNDGDPVSAWANAGTLGGAFGLDGTDQTTRPALATIQGRRCVLFDGSNDRLKLLNGSTPISAPSSLGGNNSWTVSAWVLNPVIASTEAYLCWASNAEPAGSRCTFLYGYHNGDGAAMHGVTTMNLNMPFIPVPAANVWHHIAVTFDGSMEKVYADGFLNESENKTLNITSGQPFLLGTMYSTPTGGSQGTRYSGYIASLSVYDQALTESEIRNLATYTISGTVTGPGGAPLAGAVVGFKNTSRTTVGLATSATADADVYALADASGNYSAQLLKNGAYYSAAWKDGYTPGSDVSVTADANKTVNLSVTADAGFNLAGGRTTETDTLWASATGLGTNPVNNACDGNVSTYMSWNTSSEKDLVIDITKPDGTADSINGLTILTSSYRIYDWELWVETDADPIVSNTMNTGANWTKVYQSTGGTGGYDRTTVNGQVVNPVKLAATSARGVWIKIITGSSSDTRPLEVAVHSSAPFVPIATAKAQPDGTAVAISGSSVTYAPKDTNGARTTTFFYVEDGAKTAGIRIQNPTGPLDTLKVNDTVSVLGTMATIAATGERYINAQLAPVGSLGSGITPDTATTSTVQSDSNLAGKFVAVQDTVREVAGDGSWFTIGNNYTKVYVDGVQLPANLATVGDTIKVMGPVGKENSGGVKSVIWLYNYEKPTGTADEFTFFLVSDLHYGADSTSDPSNREVIDNMNALPGTAYPAALGGYVQTPRGVLAAGDLTEQGSDAQFNTFANDYGINADGRLRYPIFEGLGNHDGRVTLSAAQRIIARTPYRRNLTGISSNGVHYSWDWNSVHFVHLNRVPVDVSDPSVPTANDPCYALQFVQQDLAANVGSSGRPVFIVHHYGFEEFSATWWTDKERSDYYDAISGYNIIGIGHGHKHSIAKYQWDGTTFGPSLPNGIDVFEDSSGYNKTSLTAGGFYVMRVRNNQLAWAQRWYNPATSQWEWGLSGTKTITTP